MCNELKTEETELETFICDCCRGEFEIGTSLRDDDGNFYCSTDCAEHSGAEIEHRRQESWSGRYI